MDFFKTFLPAIIAMVKMVLDGLVKGEALSEHGKMALISAYVELSIWGQHFAADSDNELDDDAIEALLDSIVDTASEAGVELPELPLFDEEPEPPAN